MKKPVILLLPGQAFDPLMHEKAYVLYKTYTNAIIAAGGLPVMLLSPELAEDYAAIADGLLITGAQDYAPVDGLLKPEHYKERNEWEIPIIHTFAEAKKPILGVCHGLQILNLAFGGSLKHKFKLEDGVEHNGTIHEVETLYGSFVQRHLGKRFLVNSLHNTRIDALADGFRVTAKSPDGVIEATEHLSLPIFAFQWHPEKMRGDEPYPYRGPCTDGLFRDFIRMCGK